VTENGASMPVTENGASDASGNFEADRVGITANFVYTQ